jgi:hypothetical protein
VQTREIIKVGVVGKNCSTDAGVTFQGLHERVTSKRVDNLLLPVRVDLKQQLTGQTQPAFPRSDEGGMWTGNLVN